ncbi:MAG: hypothetical protein IV090_00960 [Candidatus Sericytochromatia bacterium]|nr:hypothetical protein [Candidatus Sericytochromatia bacterium]
MPSASLSTAHDIFEALQLLIADECRWDVNSQLSANKKLKIKEENPSSTIEWVQLEGFDGPVLAFKMDSAEGKISPLLNESCKDIHKGCDAVIFARLKGKNFVFICELKSGSPKGFTQQFQSTEAFLDYLNALLSRFSAFSLCDFQRERILFSTQNKNPVHSKRKSPQKIEKDSMSYFADTSCSRTNLRHIERYISTKSIPK